MSVDWEGMLLVDKPAGPTSHDVVARIRRLTGQPRAGHTGTLDPPATGLLVVLLGRATRLAGYVPSAPKNYVGTLQLGISTLTDDLTAPASERHEGALPDAGQVRAAAAALVGSGWQVPPRVSARRVGGKRLYRAARQGEALEAPPAAIDVLRFEVVPTAEAGVWTFDASVSAGTYVRGLVRDMGASLGCGAAVASLRRTGIGSLDVADAVAGDDPDRLRDAFVPLDEVPLGGSSVLLGADAAAGFRHGRKTDTDRPDGLVAARDERGALLGIGWVESGALAPRVVLEAPSSGRLPRAHSL